MKTLLKVLGVAATVIVACLILAAAIVYSVSNKQITRRYRAGASWVRVSRDSAAVTRGQHIVQALGKCVDCHGENLGGTMFINSRAFGQIAAPNLTRGRGGRAASWTDQDLALAIQHGVKPNGRGSFIMPAEAYRHLSEDDLAAVIAYIRAAPPVDSTWPEPKFGPVARVLMTLGVLKGFPASYIDHERADVMGRPNPDTTAEYGRYLVQIGGCSSCHNAALSGGPTGQPGSPPAANLTTAGIGDWTEADFIRVLREGKKPGGVDINNEFMPWRSSGRMTDAEIHAVWLYLRALPPKEFGAK